MFNQHNGVFQSNNKWCAIATIDGFVKHLGTYNSVDQANAVFHIANIVQIGFTPATDPGILTIQQRLHIRYAYFDGSLYYRTTKEKVVGIPNSRGPTIQVGRTVYTIDSMIWLYHHGTMPDEIWHCDNNPANNKIENLRRSTCSANRKLAHNKNHRLTTKIVTMR